MANTITLTHIYECDDVAPGGMAVSSETECGVGASLEEAKWDIAFRTFGMDIDPGEVTFIEDV